MPNARHVLALLKTHIRGDDQEFMSVAMQVAAQEARQGHTKLAEQIRELIDRAKLERTHSQQRLLVLEPKGDLASLVTLQEPTARLASLVLPTELEARLRRVLLEYRQQRRLREHDLQPRRKLLFVGAPGTGKTTAAAAMAAELHIPLLVARLEGIITKFMGETAAKLRTIFDAMTIRAGVYLFDEFDALGTRRNQANDVGEIRRVLNSFLQFLEKDTSDSLVIAATNHPELLDRALFRRFDDIIEFAAPDRELAEALMRSRLANFELHELCWSELLAEGEGLSQAELVRASDDAAKDAVLAESSTVAHDRLLAAIRERKRTHPSDSH
ncbi:MAG: ATP-binding protein [Acidobacteriia bacterium]|nr:ATP-binding protein [Terriglobia bacterium]